SATCRSWATGSPATTEPEPPFRLALALALAHDQGDLRAAREPCARLGVLRDDVALLHALRELAGDLPDAAVVRLDGTARRSEGLPCDFRHDASRRRRLLVERG